jgi:hypothetical protein
MEEKGQSSHADSKPAATAAQNQARSVGARKSTGKRVTKSGDSGKGSTRKSDIRKPGRPPKPAIKRSSGTRRSPPGGRA